MIELNIKNEIVYYPRESTEAKPFSKKYKRYENISSAYPSDDFKKNTVTSFNNDTFMNVVNYELLFNNIDSVEYKILKCIVEGDYQKRTNLAEDCFLSTTALDYHLKKLYKHFGVSSYGEFYENLKSMCKYIDISKIQPKE